MRDFDDPDWENPEEEFPSRRRPSGAGPSSTGSRVFLALFMLIFVGVGISVLVFVWSAPQTGFGSVPGFFKVFASFIALAFVLMGGRGVLLALSGESPATGPARSSSSTSYSPLEKKSRSYTCGHCGATLESGVEVSPSGDVKCSYCDSWFNIHH